MNASANRESAERSRTGAIWPLLAWWLVLAGLWMLLVDTLSVAEVLCAVAAAAVGALVTRLALASGIAPMSPSPVLLASIVRQLARVPADLWLLTVVLARALAGHRRPGRLHQIPLGLPIDTAANARRAGIEWAGSIAPNTIVLGVDGREVVVHQLADRYGERASVVEIG